MDVWCCLWTFPKFWEESMCWLNWFSLSHKSSLDIPALLNMKTCCRIFLHAAIFVCPCSVCQALCIHAGLSAPSPFPKDYTWMSIHWMAISGKLLNTWIMLLKVKKQTMFGEPQQISQLTVTWIYLPLFPRLLNRNWNIDSQINFCAITVKSLPCKPLGPTEQAWLHWVLPGLTLPQPDTGLWLYSN